MFKYHRKNGFVERCGPQMWLCLFMFRPIILKQLNSLTSFDTFIISVAKWVTLQTGEESSSSTSGTGKDYFVCFVVLFVCFKNHYLQKIVQFIFNVYSFSIHNILHNLLSIMRVSRYRTIVFNVCLIATKKAYSPLTDIRYRVEAGQIAHYRICLNCH